VGGLRQQCALYLTVLLGSPGSHRPQPMDPHSRFEDGVLSTQLTPDRGEPEVEDRYAPIHNMDAEGNAASTRDAAVDNKLGLDALLGRTVCVNVNELRLGFSNTTSIPGQRYIGWRRGEEMRRTATGSISGR
jgi:hypothetical protein